LDQILGEDHAAKNEDKVSLVLNFVLPLY